METKASTESGNLVCVKCGVESGSADWLSFHWEEGYLGFICNVCKDGIDPVLLKIINHEIENRLHSLGVKQVGCMSCGRLIFWLRTKNDRSAPVQSDLISHFATCPQAKKFKVEDNKKNKKEQ